MRQVTYYLPNIYLEENIELSNCRLISARDNESAKKMIDIQTFENHDGALIEVKGFNTGDIFSNEINEKTHAELEIIKFSYFIVSISNLHSFTSNDSFNLFPILEKNKDISFEQKICFSNGVANYLLSLDKFYNYKSRLGVFTKVSLSNHELKHYETIRQLPLDDDDLITISIFNKTRKLYTDDDFIDRVLFARISIERLVKKRGYDLKKYTKTFLNDAMIIVEDKALKNESLSDFYLKYVANKKEDIFLNIEGYLESLRKSRHALAHAGEQSSDFENIGYYMIWFPLAFLISFGKEKISAEIALRILFFLAASSIKTESWHKREFTLNSMKRTVLETYEYISVTMPRYIETENLVYIKASLTGMSNCLESAIRS